MTYNLTVKLVQVKSAPLLARSTSSTALRCRKQRYCTTLAVISPNVRVLWHSHERLRHLRMCYIKQGTRGGPLLIATPGPSAVA